MKKYMLKSLEDIQQIPYYDLSINMEWRKGIIELCLLNKVVTDEYKVEVEDNSEVKFYIITENYPVPNSFLIEVSEDYIPEKSVYCKVYNDLEDTLLEELGISSFNSDLYNPLLEEVYRDSSRYNVVDGEEADYGLIDYYDLYKNKICRYINKGGDSYEYLWDPHFLNKVKDRIKEFQEKILEEKLKGIDKWE